MESKDQYRITVLVCTVEILALFPIAAFPALVPFFKEFWKLNNTQAGWISASYYAGYMLLVPLLSAITDRLDARSIMKIASLLGLCASLFFALAAEGFRSAMFLRFLSGISLAGIYMPGLKIVSDHTAGFLQSRCVSLYTASFSIGASLSYLVAGEIFSIAGWRPVFLSTAACTLFAYLMIGRIPEPIFSRESARSWKQDFIAVLKNRSSMRYVLGYAAHMWELFSTRSWIVAFLAFSNGLNPGVKSMLKPTQVAFLMALAGLPASIFGNELAARYGRIRIISAVMLLSGLCGSSLGFCSGMPFYAVSLLSILYGILIIGDSAALTAGVVASAPDKLRGTTLAVHSTIGFFSAFAGPLATGVVLDLFGGGRRAWSMAFICIAISSIFGPLFFVKAKRE